MPVCTCCGLFTSDETCPLCGMGHYAEFHWGNDLSNQISGMMAAQTWGYNWNRAYGPALSITGLTPGALERLRNDIIVEGE